MSIGQTQAYRRRATAGSGVSVNGRNAGELSTSGDTIDRLRACLDRVPDVRQQRVERLRQMIGAGQFVISPLRIADAMLCG